MSQPTPYLAEAITSFQKYYADFNDQGFLADERNYKLEASRLARDKLSEEVMGELLRQGRFDELMASVKTIFRSKTTLPSPQEKVTIANIAGEKVEKFIRAFHTFLYGAPPWQERGVQFAETFKQITGENISWPQLTFFPFLLFPEEHLFLKPEAMKKATEIVGYQWDYRYAPDINTYLQFQQLARHLMAELKALDPKDMIDIQSFLWVIANGAPNYWRVRPGRDAVYWTQFRDLERIAAGWDDIGSLTKYSSKEGIKAALLAKQNKAPQAVANIANQLNHLRTMKIGDRIFILGQRTILGIGEITDNYEYVQGEWPTGSQDYNHHHYQVRWLNLTPKSIKDLPDSLQNRLDNPQTVVDITRNDANIIRQTLYPELIMNKKTIDQLSTYLNAHGFHFPPELLTTYYLSLQTKPFVILTGISGTGKTKLAQLFAEWISSDGKNHHVFLSVRPDWTDNRGMLGFYNLITQTYQTTDFLRLLTQATLESNAPHFVILDEMNLAKVEYYFADFLSVLESRHVEKGEMKQERLRLHDLPRCVLAQGETAWDEETELEEEIGRMCRVRCEGCPLRAGVDESKWSPGWAISSFAEARLAGFKPERYVPPRLAVPVNVYFTGTVNVDETTYIFSPKVLDRANTIEFNQVNLDDYFAAAATVTDTIPASDAARQGFTFNGKFIQLPKGIPGLRSDPGLEPYRQRLSELNTLLAPYTMHFGYRVADEVLLYLWGAQNLGEADFNLDTAFDYQVYQKILPKFHGSEAKLGKPLAALQDFCEKYKFQHSLTKVKLMRDHLEKEGFASFA